MRLKYVWRSPGGLDVRVHDILNRSSAATESTAALRERWKLARRHHLWKMAYKAFGRWTTDVIRIMVVTENGNAGNRFVLGVNYTQKKLVLIENTLRSARSIPDADNIYKQVFESVPHALSIRSLLAARSVERTPALDGMWHARTVNAILSKWFVLATRTFGRTFYNGSGLEKDGSGCTQPLAPRLVALATIVVTRVSLDLPRSAIRTCTFDAELNPHIVVDRAFEWFYRRLAILPFVDDDSAGGPWLATTAEACERAVALLEFNSNFARTPAAPVNESTSLQGPIGQ